MKKTHPSHGRDAGADPAFPLQLCHLQARDPRQTLSKQEQRGIPGCLKCICVAKKRGRLAKLPREPPR
eukprot:3252877-Rhodomonas_salina.1